MGSALQPYLHIFKQQQVPKLCITQLCSKDGQRSFFIMKNIRRRRKNTNKNNQPVSSLQIFHVNIFRLDKHISVCGSSELNPRLWCVRLEKGSNIYYSPCETEQEKQQRLSSFLSTLFIPVSLQPTNSGPQFFCQSCLSIALLDRLKSEHPERSAIAFLCVMKMSRKKNYSSVWSMGPNSFALQVNLL